MSEIPNIHHNNSHVPVLLEQTLKVLQPKEGERYLDLTAGYGGHAQAVLDRTKNPQGAVLVDRDENAIKALKSFEQAGAEVIHSDYKSATKTLEQAGEQFDLILMDIGVSSPHLDKAERGFSFQHEGPLDMRMDQSSGITAEQLIQTASQEELERILKHYGEEPRAKRIATAMKAEKPSTTTQLAELVEETIGRTGKIHPATRTFQSLRIAVNDELSQLEDTLPHVLSLLKPGGRMAVISFHSLEDRIVKEFFKNESYGYEAQLKVITKKPISGTEDVFNRRARSAKLRAAIKINT